MRVRHDCGGAMGQNSLDKFLRGDQGALQMNMRIQKAGQDNPAGAVLLFSAGVVSHAHDQSLCHGDVGGAELI